MPEERLAHNAVWSSSSLKGCCGIMELYRLRAGYMTETARDSEIDRVISAGDTTVVPVEAASTVQRTLKMIDDATLRWCYPVNWAFTAVLEGIIATQYNLVVLSENLDNDGDVHNGPFRTLRFIEWLQENDVGEVVATPERRSHRGGGHPLQVWVFYPNKGKANTLINKCQKLIVKYLEDINSVEEQVAQQRKDRNANLIGALTEAW